jgi:HEPN superfamily RES-like protein/RES domain-containing protein
MEEGWSSVGEKYACSKCFDDYAIREFIEDTAVSRQCDYCGRRSKKPIAAEMDEILSFVSDGIRREYEPPEEHVPHDSSDGGWQLFEPTDSYDLLIDLGLGRGPESVFYDLEAAFSHRQWVQKNPFSLSSGEALQFTWESFCEQIKHHTRFVFYRTKSQTVSMEELGHAEPYEILETIGELVTKFNLITTLNAGSRIMRARQHKRTERFKAAAELGPPPPKCSSQSRMSPAGIPMFYGADSRQTAFAETFDPTAKAKRAVTFGAFRTTRTLLLLDLTMLPPVPSLFDEGRHVDRMPLIFLHGFRDDIVKPVIRDGSEQYEYVPTQVVAEYFRHVFEPKESKKLDGIKFESSRYEDGVCYSLFCTADDCTDPPTQSDETLYLNGIRHCRINFKTRTFK